MEGRLSGASSGGQGVHEVNAAALGEPYTGRLITPLCSAFSFCWYLTERCVLTQLHGFVQDDELLDSDEDEGEKLNNAKELAGMRVRHDADELGEGETMILTLADRNILDEHGEVDEDKDELENALVVYFCDVFIWSIPLAHAFAAVPLIYCSVPVQAMFSACRPCSVQQERLITAFGCRAKFRPILSRCCMVP